MGRIVMTKKELIQFLKKNLTVEVCHPKHDVGYYGILMEPDEHNITVKIKLLGRTICEGTSCS
jgi:hypothetical protein|uniref:Uncharacterized protein n=1 Tax=CrAss-like virus sp. ctelJ1 TaxID=2825838 RepID=A0A8S5V2M9_9CAUD|nr:MAG TPA: hypothetical protein [CrAss-like virus sp. ctelJ1]